MNAAEPPRAGATTASPGKPPASASLRGIALICFAVAMFAALDVVAKFLVREVPVPELVWARYTSQALLMVAVLGPRLGFGLVRTARPGVQLARALLLLSCSALFFTALLFLPLAEASALGFAAPLFVTALSVPMLKERVGPRRWIAVSVGFLGVLLVVRPGGAVLHWAVLLPLTMALFYSLYQILTRLIAGHERPLASLFWTALVGSLLTTLALPWIWQAPTSLGVAALMAATGLMGGIGHFAMIKAFETAPASLLAPYTYTQLVWATAFGYLAFGDFPDGWTLVGMGVIVASGVYIFYRERRLARA